MSVCVCVCVNAQGKRRSLCERQMEEMCSHGIFHMDFSAGSWIWETGLVGV